MAASEIENDPVYQLARQAGRNDAAAIRLNYQNATLVNPDQDAKAQSLARMMRIPTDAVRDYPQDVEQQAAAQSLDAEKMMRETPALARMLQVQDKANIAHDDLTNLSEMERNIRKYGELKAPSGPEASFSTIAMGLLKALPQGLEATRQGINQQWADLFGTESMKRNAAQKAAAVQMDILTSTPEFESSTARGLYSGGTSIVRQAPGLAAAIILRNPSLALAGAGVQTEAESYSKYRNRGGGVGESFAGAIGEGATEVATEMMPMGFLVNKLGKVGAGEFLKGFLGRELAGEELATLVQDALDTAVANPDKTWGEYLAERPEAAYETALATLVQSGVMTGAHAVASRLGHKEQQAKQAEEKAALLDTINKFAEASKLRSRDTTTTREYLQSIMDEGNDAVFITPQALAQSGMGAKIAAEIPEVADQLISAQVTGHDIRLPIADLMAKLPGEELASTIIPHVSDQPGGFTLVSSQEFMQSEKAKDLKNEVERVLTEQLGDDTFKQSQERVKQAVLDGLNSAGRWGTEKNEVEATLVAARSAVRAAQLGITPEQFFAKYLLKAHAEALGGQHYDQDGQLITDTANFQNWFKDSKTVDAQGKPLQMYHGTAQNIHQFRAKQAGAIFTTSNPAFADDYTEMSKEWMVDHHEEILTPEQIATAKDQAEIAIREEFAGDPEKADILAHEMRVGDRLTNIKARSLFNKAIADQMPSGPNILPVYVSAQNPFDYENPAHIAALVEELNKETDQWGRPRGSNGGGFYANGNWQEIEKSFVQKAIKALGFDGFYVNEGGHKNLAVYNPSQIKSVFNDGSFDPNNPNILHQEEIGGKNSITGDLSKVNADVRDAVESYLARKPEAEQARIRANLEALKGTSWAAAAVKGMAYREMLERAMEGKDISNLEVNAIWGKQDMGASKIVKAFKLYPQLGETAIRKLIAAYDFVGGNRKAENDISTSFANCDPSAECATHCYAAGSNARPSEIAKSEFTEFVMEKFPDIVADEVAQAYGITEAAKAGLSLRLNDKGDLSEAQVQFVANMNARGIAMQVFSKRPELLRQLSDENLKMLSVDGSNMEVAYANPDLRLAVVITDEMTEDMLVPIHDRVSVYLPVNLKGKAITNEELKSRFPNLFKRMRSENLCPVDGGKLVTKPGTSFVDIRDRTAEKGTWTCTACDLYGNAGCFKGDRQTNQRKAQVLMLTDVKKELAIKKARIELQKQLDLLKTLGDIDGELHERISQSLTARQPGVWADADRPGEFRDGAQEGAVPGQEGAGGGRARPNADAGGQATGGPDSLNQGTGNRGSITFNVYEVKGANDKTIGYVQAESKEQAEQLAAKDDNLKGYQSIADKPASLISLLSGADLSTVVHELGHYFLETDIQLASTIVSEARAFGYDTLSEGEKEILNDVSQLLTWHGIQGPVEDQLDQWHTMDFEEKRSYHEKTAESFEKYLFEGKAPSIELQPYFQKLRAWMLQVYKSITKFLNANPDAGQLTDEVRQVFDRMLASSEQIKLAEQARSMMPLFTSAQQAGMTEEEFARYQNDDVHATLTAAEQLQARTLRDMRWMENAKSRELKRLQREAGEKRREVKMEARREVMSQPVYRAWQFLTGKLSAEDKAAVTPPDQRKSTSGKVDETIDSLFMAIAKLGGINVDSAKSLWGIDPKERSSQPLFGKPVINKSKGMSVDAMGELLSQYGYFKLDEHGKYDQHDFEEKFMAEYRGTPQYSVSYEYANQDEGRPGEGADLENLGAGRFDLVGLRETGIPQEILDHIINLKMTAKDGLHPDLVVDKFPEFESADELVRMLAAVPTPKDAIEALTDRMMLERYGDLASPEAIQEAADKAIHNEVRARFVRTQYVAAAKAAGQPRMLDQAAKLFVSQMIDRLMIRNIKPGQYAAAEVRAAKAAADAMKQGDAQQVAVESRNQLINVMATKAAYDAVEEIEQAKRFFAKVLGGKDADMAKKRDMDMVNAARAVLAQFGYGGKAERAIDYLKAVKQYDEAMYNVLVQSVESAEAMAKPLNELTLEELRGVRAEVEALWHLSSRSNQMEVDGRLLDRQDVIEALVNRMQALGIPENEPGTSSAITPEEEMGLRLKQTLALGVRVETWADIKDGFDKMGAFRRYIYQPIKDAADRYRADKVKFLRQFRESLTSVAPVMKREVIAAPELGYTFGKDSGGVAMNEVMHAILHTGNESNKRKLLLGRGWATELPDGTVDTRMWDAFVARLVKEGKLTKAHYDFAQQVWDLLESMKPMAQKAHRDAYGRYFDEITANEFVTPFGVYRGGYVPAKVDSRIVKDGELKKLIEEGKDGMAYAFPSTSKGFTKGRVEYNKPLMLDLRTLAQHIDQVLKFSHLENPTKDATRLLTNNDLSNPLNRMDPSAINSLLIPWLQRSAMQQVTTPVAGYGWQMRMLNFIRTRTSMATMFANLSNTVQQLTGFMLAGVKVRNSSMLSATAQYMKNPKAMNEAVTTMSSFMEHRMNDEMSAMMGDIEEILLNPNMYEKAQEWTKKHQFFFQAALDNVMGPIIWTAAYNEAVEAGHDEKDSARIADGIVRQTQGSSLPEDVSNIEVGNAFARFFMQFAGWFNMQANLVGGELAKTSQEMGMRKGMGRGLYIFMMGFYAPALVAEMISQAFRGGPDDDDKDGEYLDDWLMALFVWGPLRNLTAFVPGAGQAVNSMVARFNGNPNDDRMSIAPAVSAIEGALAVPYDLYSHVVDNGKANLKKTVKDVGMLISLTTGLPASAAARPISYLGGMADEKIEPTDSMDFIRGLITGTPSPESKVR